MTPEKWQAAAVVLGVSFALFVVVAILLDRLGASTRTRLAVSVVSISFYLALSIILDFSYVESPIIFGAISSLLVIGSTQIGLLFGRLRHDSAA